MKDGISHLKSDSEHSEMVSAIEESHLFEVEKDDDAGTVKATHKKSGMVVFRSIDKGTGAWIVTHHKKLFI